MSEPNRASYLFGSVTCSVPKAVFDSVHAGDSNMKYTLEDSKTFPPTLFGPMPSKRDKITREQAIVNATINGANALYLEDETDSIEVGNMEVFFTMAAGETVYKQDGAEEKVTFHTDARWLVM